MVVVAEHYSDKALSLLRKDCRMVRVDGRNDRAGLLQAVRNAQGLLIHTYTRVDEQLLEAATRLKVVGRSGVGLDQIDLDACKRRHVRVVFTPWANTYSVVEFTIGLMIALVRKLTYFDRVIRAGEFLSVRNSPHGPQLRGKVLGIIGMGRIGSRVAAVAHAMGMKIIYNDIAKVGPFDFPARSVSKRTIYTKSDVISLHCTLTPLTRGLINAEVLRQLKPTAYLINAARGPIVDIDALAEALRSGRLAGAAIETFPTEPPDVSHPLFACENALLTPHVAARTPEAMAGMDAVVEDVLRVLKGRRPKYPAV